MLRPADLSSAAGGNLPLRAGKPLAKHVDAKWGTLQLRFMGNRLEGQLDTFAPFGRAKDFLVFSCDLLCR